MTIRARAASSPNGCLSILGPDVPLHFTAFHPDFKLRDKPPTPPETLHARAPDCARGGLAFCLRRQYLGRRFGYRVPELRRGIDLPLLAQCDQQSPEERRLPEVPPNYSGTLDESGGSRAAFLSIEPRRSRRNTKPTISDSPVPVPHRRQ